MAISTHSNVFELLIPIICEHTGFRPAEVLPGVRLREDLDVDSLAMHGVLMSVEDAWGVMPAAQQLSGVVTVADLVHLIEALQVPS